MSRVIVFGSINLDLVTRVKLHPEPGETLIGSDYESLPGGKGANQALAAAKALDKPSNSIMIGATGNDDFARISLSNLRRAGLDLSLVKTTKSGTGIAMITVNELGENNIIVCPNANSHANADQFTHIEFSSSDVLLTQQETPLKEVWTAHALAKKSNAIVVHNAAPAASIPEVAFQNIDYLIVNASEAFSLGKELDVKVVGIENIAVEIAKQIEIAVILTLGEKGVVCIIQGKKTHHPAISVEVVDTTGAGDVFCGTFAASIASGHSPINAVEKSIIAASTACGRFGAQFID